MTAEADVELPSDDRPSRLARGASRPTSTDENPDDIRNVDRKVREFRVMHPLGQIKSEPVAEYTRVGQPDKPDTWTFRASVWREYKAGSVVPDSVAHCTITGNPDGDELTDRYPQQSAETIAIGRALRFLAVDSINIPDSLEG